MVNIQTSKETKKKEGKRKTQASIMDLLEVKDPQIRGTARVFKLRRNVTYRHLREEPIKIRVVVSEVRREFNFHNERPIYLTTDRLPLIRSEIGLWSPFSLSLSHPLPSRPGPFVEAQTSPCRFFLVPRYTNLILRPALRAITFVGCAL